MEDSPFVLAMRTSPGQVRLLALPLRRYTVGRRRDNDLCLESEPTVSRYHAEFLAEAHRLTLRDLGSTFGTFVNGAKISEAVLQDTDVVRFGKAAHAECIVQIRQAHDSQLLLRETRRLLHIARALSSSLVLDEVLEMVMQAIIEVSGAERGILMLNGDDGQLATRVAMDSSGRFISDFRMSTSVTDEVCRTGKAVIIGDLAADARFAGRESVVDLNLKRVMCLPLRVPRTSPAPAPTQSLALSTPGLQASVLLHEATDSLVLAEDSSEPRSGEVSPAFTASLRFKRLTRDTELIGVVYVDSQLNAQPFTALTYEFLQSLVSHAAVAINNSRLVAQQRAWESRLASLIEASRLLNTTLDLDRVLQVILEIVTEVVDAEHCTLFLVRDQMLEARSTHGSTDTSRRVPLATGIPGHVVMTGQSVTLANPTMDPRFDAQCHPLGAAPPTTLLCSPIRDKEGHTIGALQVSNKRSGVFRNDDVRALEAFCTHAALAIENAILFRQATEKKRLDQELEVAGEIQRRLLPASPPVIPGFSVAALNVPSIQVGGDYYDFLKIRARTTGGAGKQAHGDDKALNLWGIVIADVAGKGIPAALQMATLRASLRAQAEKYRSLATLMLRLNGTMLQVSPSSSFATVFIAALDPQTGSLSYCNAGHNAPMLVHADGSHELLAEGGPIIGILRGITFQQGKVQLCPGDVLVAYTDGVTEAQDVSEELYGEERLLAAIVENRHRDAAAVLKAVYDDVCKFEQAAARRDDLTLVIVKCGAGEC